jgi:hypothetical protein
MTWSRSIAPQTVIRRICPTCLTGAAWAAECENPMCRGELRELVKPLRVGDFDLLDDERKQDLQTRRIVAPKSHPDVLTSAEDASA